MLRHVSSCRSLASRAPLGGGGPRRDHSHARSSFSCVCLQLWGPNPAEAASVCLITPISPSSPSLFSCCGEANPVAPNLGQSSSGVLPKCKIIVRPWNNPQILTLSSEQCRDGCFRGPDWLQNRLSRDMDFFFEQQYLGQTPKTDKNPVIVSSLDWFHSAVSPVKTASLSLCSCF